MTDPSFPLIGIGTGIAAIVLWGVVCFEVLVARRRGQERRASWVLMAFTALLASIGAFASAIGGAQQLGSIHTEIPNELLSFVSNVGRGALLAAGFLVLTHGRVPRKGGDS